MTPSRTRTAFAGVLFGETESDQDNHLLVVGAQQSETTNVGMSTTTTTTDSSTSSRTKPGVASASELQEFITAAAAAGSDRLLIADVRNPNLDVEPGDAKSIAVAPLPTPETRPLAQLLTYDRTTNSMPIPEVNKDTYIITHCGGGGRGLLAKNYLEQHGFKNVMNGGGPKEKELWAIFGDMWTNALAKTEKLLLVSRKQKHWTMLLWNCWNETPNSCVSLL